jgi:hypothetical protein
MAHPMPLFRSPVQAVALAELTELEAKWQNLPTAVMAGSAAKTRAAQLAKQTAHDELHAKVKVYNKEYRPHFVGPQAVATPQRLARWCTQMAGLYRVARPNKCPTELIEWTRRWADRVAERLGRDPPGPLDPVTTAAEAIEEFEATAAWCVDLVSATASRIAA